MSFYQRVYYNLHRIFLLGDRPTKNPLAHKRFDAVKLFFFLWHFSCGLAVGGWLGRYFLLPPAQSGKLIVATTVFSFLLMAFLFPADNQLALLDKQEQKRKQGKRDAEMLVVSTLFFLSLAGGYWLFIAAIR